MKDSTHPFSFLATVTDSLALDKYLRECRHRIEDSATSFCPKSAMESTHLSFLSIMCDQKTLFCVYLLYAQYGTLIVPESEI